jgi:hypothetical protein
MTTLRKVGVEVAKKWLDGAAILGVRSMRMNSPQALGPSIRPNAIPRDRDGIRETLTSFRCSRARSNRTRKWLITAAISGSR